MAYVADYVLENCNNPGTGSFTLTGAPTGRANFGSAFASGSTVYYGATDGSGNWETGMGTWTSGSPSTLSRTTVFTNSAGNTSPVKFTGPLQVYPTVPAGRTVCLEPDGQTLVVPGINTQRGVLGSLAITSQTANGNVLTDSSGWASANNVIPSTNFAARGVTMDIALNLTIFPGAFTGPGGRVYFSLAVTDNVTGNSLTTAGDSAYVSSSADGKINARALVYGATVGRSYNVGVNYNASSSVGGGTISSGGMKMTGGYYIRSEC